VSTHRIPTRHDWIMLEPLSLNDWLVVDRGQEFLTGDGVIGHIQVFLGIFEALNKNAPLERSFFDNLESAIDSFAPWPAENAATDLPAAAVL
jgi:hypothetical protein